MKTVMLGVAMMLGACVARADVPVQLEDFMAARDRIEWQAGALYDGRFDDGAPFRIDLVYPLPAGVSKSDAGGFRQLVWDQRRYQGQPSGLYANEEAKAGEPIRLQVLGEQDRARGAVYTVTLAADRATGRGILSTPDGRQRAFTLRRSVPYTGVVVKRPAPPALADHGYYTEHGFVFSAFFPVLGDPDADAWIRERAGICRDEGDCSNDVHILWRSPSLVSLKAWTWGDSGGAHGDGYFETRQYRIDGRAMTPLGLDAFINLSDRCMDTISAYMVASLSAQKMPQADRAGIDASGAAPFTPTPDGIAFHFNLYQVGGYAYGTPTVFVPKAEMKGCVRYLPAD